MKNIHLLPTTQKSKIFFNHNEGFEKYQFSKEPFINGLTNTTNQNIYITSDEEIKDGDWCLLNNRLVVRYFKPPVESKSFKKIILTTDTDLIKDGVQVIDDEFLEWFCKNSNCEYVEIDLLKRGIYDEYKYKIIIPKEEPKQECIATKNMHLDAKMAYDSLPKQETLEEAAESLYSEKEVIQLLMKLNQEITEVEDVREWFAENKK